MNECIFAIPSSDGVTRYRVVLSVSSDKVHCECECKAGAFGKLCRHKLLVLLGEANRYLVNESDDTYERLLGMVKESSVGASIRDMQEAEDHVQHYKKILGQSKQRLEFLLRS